MPFTPFNREQTAFKSGVQILASDDFKYTEEGGTLDAAAIGERYVPCGFPFVRDTASGRYVPFVAATHVTGSALNAGFTDPVICDVDFNCDGVHDIVMGALIWRGSVYPGKLPAEVTAEFKAVTPNIRYVTRGL
jgi:hypothetical protein